MFKEAVDGVEKYRNDFKLIRRQLSSFAHKDVDEIKRKKVLQNQDSNDESNQPRKKLKPYTETESIELPMDCISSDTNIFKEIDKSDHLEAKTEDAVAQNKEEEIGKPEQIEGCANDTIKPTIQKEIGKSDEIAAFPDDAIEQTIPKEIGQSDEILGKSDEIAAFPDDAIEQTIPKEIGQSDEILGKSDEIAAFPDDAIEQTIPKEIGQSDEILGKSDEIAAFPDDAIEQTIPKEIGQSDEILGKSDEIAAFPDDANEQTIPKEIGQSDEILSKSDKIAAFPDGAIEQSIPKEICKTDEIVGKSDEIAAVPDDAIEQTIPKEIDKANQMSASTMHKTTSQAKTEVKFNNNQGRPVTENGFPVTSDENAVEISTLKSQLTKTLLEKEEIRARLSDLEAELSRERQIRTNNIGLASSIAALRVIAIIIQHVYLDDVPVSVNLVCPYLLIDVYFYLTSNLFLLFRLSYIFDCFLHQSFTLLYSSTDC